MAIEHRENRFAVVAIEKGFITEEQAVKAMAVQLRENLEGKEHRRIGDILISLDYIADSQVDEVLIDLWDSLNIKP